MPYSAIHIGSRWKIQHRSQVENTHNTQTKHTLRVRSRAGRTRLPPVTDRSDRTACATLVCDRTPIERPTAPTQVTVGRNMSVVTEIDS